MDLKLPHRGKKEEENVMAIKNMLQLFLGGGGGGGEEGVYPLVYP